MEYGCDYKIRNMAVRKNKDTLGVPIKINEMAKDGNCFFRTISYELCGTAEHHLLLRQAIVKYMSEDKAKMFSEYINRNVQTYLDETLMHNDGIWAIDVEIVATATLLQTTIYVYSDINNNLKWYKFNPLEKRMPFVTSSIYI